MTAVLARARQLSANPAEAARAIVVAACALALIAAGHAWPF